MAETMNSAQLQMEIDLLQAQLTPLNARLNDLKCRHRDALSIEWIRANNVKRGDVLSCDAEGLPYFGHIREFCNYLRDKNPPQRWATWNGTIHSVAELKDGKFFPTAGNINDIPKEKP